MYNRSFNQSDDHPVPAAFLRGVELFVRNTDICFDALFRIKFGHSEAHGVTDGIAEAFADSALDLFPDGFCLCSGFLYVCIHHDHDEFLTAPAIDTVGGFRISLHDTGHVLQNLISGVMTVGIVDGLELVDVTDKEGQLPIRIRDDLVVGTLEIRKEPGTASGNLPPRGISRLRPAC